MMDWGKYGHVLASEYRKKVVLSLENGPKTPKQISDATGLYLSHVSTVIHELSDESIVECLTPNLRRGKIFALSEDGKEIAQKIMNSAK